MPAAQNIEGAVSPSFIFDSDVPDYLKQWFPMRIAHGRPERILVIKEFLDQHNVQNFLPLTHKDVVVNGKKKRVLEPAVNNLIFVRSTEERLTFMKRHHSILLPLRYILWRPHNGLPGTIIRVPDYQMDSFIRVASISDERVMYLGDKDFSNKIGKRVRIIEGVFQGIEGVVCRVKKDRRVVVSIKGVASVAISYIAPSFLEELPPLQK